MIQRLPLCSEIISNYVLNLLHFYITSISHLSHSLHLRAKPQLIYSYVTDHMCDSLVQLEQMARTNACNKITVAV